MMNATDPGPQALAEATGKLWEGARLLLAAYEADTGDVIDAPRPAWDDLEPHIQNAVIRGWTDVLRQATAATLNVCEALEFINSHGPTDLGRP